MVILREVTQDSYSMEDWERFQHFSSVPASRNVEFYKLLAFWKSLVVFFHLPSRENPKRFDITQDNFFKKYLIAAFEHLTVFYLPPYNLTLFELSVDARAKPWFLCSLNLTHCPRLSSLESKQLFSLSNSQIKYYTLCL